jgi:hypothetical protein
VNLLDLARGALAERDASEHESRPTATGEVDPVPSPDANTKRRRAKAVALLRANPEWQRAVLAEAGDPTVIGIAIRGVAYGEIEIPAAKYDPALLLALFDQYGGSIH